jgi:hypothetical protein
MFPAPNPEILRLSAVVDLDEIVSEQKLKITAKQNAQRKDIKVAQGTKEAIYVHLTWIYLWCFTLSQQDEREGQFRLN